MVSLSGIDGQTLDACAGFADGIDRRRVPLSLLMTPRPRHGEQPRPGSAVVDWVRGRRDSGDAVLMHGLNHHATPLGDWITGVNACGTLAGIGWRRAEFAALPAHEAGLRIAAGRAVMNRLELATTAFVPPRWFASPGTRGALRGHGFTLCADAGTVHDLRRGTSVAGRVLTFGRVRSDLWSSWAPVSLAGRTARRDGLVRLAIDGRELLRAGPGDGVLEAIDLVLAHGATPTTYPGLFDDARTIDPPDQHAPRIRASSSADRPAPRSPGANVSS